MKIILLTPGAGGMYCGGCMRDNTLASGLRKAGHDALLIPLYTPIQTDEPDNSLNHVFFGGVSVYLEQKSQIFRNLPAWLSKRLDDPGFLKLVSRLGLPTQPQALGDLTLSMLKGEDGYQAEELEKLAAWLVEHTSPDVICLSNALLLGMAARLREALKVPIVCTLQGEDFFLDNLPAAHREAAWGLLRDHARCVDAFIAVSRYHADLMRARMDLPAEKIHVVFNGIDLSGYAPAAQRPEGGVIGYLARMSPEKGLRTLVDAFKILCAQKTVPELRLRVAGSLSHQDKPFVKGLQAELAREGIAAHVDFLPNLERDEKIKFLQSLSVFSVPATYGESFGLYVLEALACGIPVVQPRHAAFPELLEATGGGMLCQPGDPADLAAQLESVLLNPEQAATLGRQGRQRVLERFGIERAAEGVAAVFEKTARERR